MRAAFVGALWLPRAGLHLNPVLSTSGVNTMHLDQILSSPILWIAIGALSEIIALSPLKDNSIIQLVFTMLRAAKKK